MQFPANSQSLNPYSYIMNNPLAGTDPTGFAQKDSRSICADSPGSCGSIYGTDSLSALSSVQEAPKKGLTQLAIERTAAKSVGVLRSPSNGADNAQSPTGAGSRSDQQAAPSEKGAAYKVEINGTITGLPPSPHEAMQNWITFGLQTGNQQAAGVLYFVDGVILTFTNFYTSSTGRISGNYLNEYTGTTLGAKERIEAIGEFGLGLAFGGAGRVGRGIRVPKAFCFAAGTMVLTPDGERPIEGIKEGDVVLAYDFKLDKVVTRSVKSPVRNATEHWYKLIVGSKEAKVTGAHPFWVENLQQWIYARDLKKGMILRASDAREIAIDSIERVDLQIPERTFNFEVEIDHNYFAGPKGNTVLVHNTDPREMMFSRPPSEISEADTFSSGPWRGRTVGEAVAEARRLGGLPPGLQLNATRYGPSHTLVAANNRTLWVALMAQLENISVYGLESNQVAKTVTWHISEFGGPYCPP